MSKVTSLVVACCTILAASLASAQQIHLPPAITQSQATRDIPVTTGDEAQRKLAITANQQRQVEIRRDTAKMLELTQDLELYLLRSAPGVVSADSLKKADQIEKLAKSVRSKMKQSF